MEKSKKKQKRSKKRWIGWVVGIVLLVILATGAYLYYSVFRPFSLPQTVYLYIDREADYEEVVAQLDDKAEIPSKKIFHLLAERMNYPATVKSGRYAIEDGMNMMEVIRRLRSGQQSPVDLTFNNTRTLPDLAGRISHQLMVDSLTLLDSMQEAARSGAFGFTEENFPSLFIPNTYEVYWNTSADDLLQRMKREHDAFWNDSRKGRAEKIGLSPVEVSILASIVEEEATYQDEYATVAGLYLNRLRRHAAEADPTVKFAVGDFTLRRILFRHLEVESPYNTYKNAGLPPGPIRVPSIQAIEGVLSPERHDYLFMCAKDDLSGRHNFAVTHAEHARNAAAYQRALNQRGIY